MVIQASYTQSSDQVTVAIALFSGVAGNRCGLSARKLTSGKLKGDPKARTTRIPLLPLYFQMPSGLQKWSRGTADPWKNMVELLYSSTLGVASHTEAGTLGSDS